MYFIFEHLNIIFYQL